MRSLADFMFAEILKEGENNPPAEKNKSCNIFKKIRFWLFKLKIKRKMK